MNPSLASKVQQFETDADIIHLIAHGDIQTVVATEAGPVRSLAKMIHDNQVVIDETVQSQLNPDWSEDDPTKKTFIRNKPALAKVPADVGLGLVNNTADAAKPVSAAQAAADTAVLTSAKAYADGLVVGLWDDRGNFSAAGNAYPAAGGSGLAGAVMKGDIWTVNVPGVIGGVPVAQRQTLRALEDNPGQLAASWAIGLANTDIDDSINTGVTARAPSQRAVFDALALKADKSDGLLIGDIYTTVRTLPAPAFLACDGLAYLQASYPALYALLGSPLALADAPTPATLPELQPTMSALTPDGSFLAVAAGSYLCVYTRSGNVFTKQNNITPGGSVNSLAFNNDGSLLAVGLTAAPFLAIYSRAGAVLTGLGSPATSPTSSVAAVRFSNDGTKLAVTFATAPGLYVYGVVGTVFTKWANPAVAATATPNVNGLAFSPDGSCLAISAVSAPVLELYSIAGTTLTKLASPAVMPPAGCQGRAVAFDADGSTLVVGFNQTPYVHLYSRNANVFTKLADPNPLPPGPAVYDARFSTDGKYLITGNLASPTMVSFWKRTGNAFNGITQAITQPASYGRHIAFSADGTYMAVMVDGAASLRIYSQSYNPATQFIVPKVQIGANSYIKAT
jgi:hypothetical protein